jgi:hypothetical protein
MILGFGWKVAVMIAIKFEMLSLMTTMHLVGLMPDDDYQREKDRLVRDIQSWGNPVVQRNKKAWEADCSFSKGQGRENDRFEFLMAAPRTPEFDWKGAVADFLEVAFYSQGYMSERDVIETEAAQLGVEVSDPLGFSGSARALLEIRHLRRTLMSDAGNPYTFIWKMQEEIRELRDELGSLRASQSQPTRGPKIDQSEHQNTYEIESLQKDLQRLLTAAALSDAQGDAYWAGSHRGEAAKIESKLRALGA